MTVSPNPKSMMERLREPGPLNRLFNAFAKDQRAEVGRILGRPHVSTTVFNIVDNARGRLEEGNRASPLRIHRQCQAGCSACCQTVAVDVTPLEALAVAEFLQQNLDTQELRLVREKLLANCEKRRVMSTAERQATAMECALLDENGLCRVYYSRPLVCAGVFSFSSDACDNACASTKLVQESVPIDVPAKVSAMGISGGLQRGLVEAGLDGNLYDLNSIVARALDTPNAVDRWLAGEDVFKGCVCTDPHSPPRLRPNIRIDEAETHQKSKQTKHGRQKR